MFLEAAAAGRLRWPMPFSAATCGEKRNLGAAEGWQGKSTMDQDTKVNLRHPLGEKTKNASWAWQGKIKYLEFPCQAGRVKQINTWQGTRIMGSLTYFYPLIWVMTNHF